MTLTVRNLSFAHVHQPTLVSINATFEAGKLTVILGPNGAGKSTLLACLAGLWSRRQDPSACMMTTFMA